MTFWKRSEQRRRRDGHLPEHSDADAWQDWFDGLRKLEERGLITVEWKLYWTTIPARIKRVALTKLGEVEVRKERALMNVAN